MLVKDSRLTELDAKLFKAKLERLVLIAEREQLKKDRDATIKVIKSIK